MTTAFFFVEIIVGYTSNSLALVADSFHMLSDIISLSIGLYAVRVAKRSAFGQHTFGFVRAEVLGALVNAVFLLALVFSIMVEAISRFFEVSEIKHTTLLLWVGGVGLFINLVGLALFASGECVCMHVNVCACACACVVFWCRTLTCGSQVMAMGTRMGAGTGMGTDTGRTAR